MGLPMSPHGDSRANNKKYRMVAHLHTHPKLASNHHEHRDIVNDPYMKEEHFIKSILKRMKDKSETRRIFI